MTLVSARAFSPGGTFLTEFDAFQVNSVVWRIETGQSELSVPYSSPRCTRTNLKAGNLLYLEFEDLPPFAGVMGRRSRGDDAVTVLAAQPRKLLSWRYSDGGLIYSDNRNAVARSLLRLANGVYDTLIDAGARYASSGSIVAAYNYQQLDTILDDLARGEEYTITPYLTNSGRLRFLLDWYPRAGRDLRDRVALIAGANVTSVTLDEQEPFYNQVLAIGIGADDEADWATRPVAVALNRDSRDRHGLRTDIIMRNDVSDPATLQAIADDELSKSAWPQMRATLDVVSAAPATYDAYNVGDIVTLEALQDHDEWSFRGPVRILAREWTADDTCVLEVAEWLD